MTKFDGDVETVRVLRELGIVSFLNSLHFEKFHDRIEQLQRKCTASSQYGDTFCNEGFCFEKKTVTNFMYICLCNNLLPFSILFYEDDRRNNFHIVDVVVTIQLKVKIRCSTGNFIKNIA